jgi:hypothetical protein
MLLRCIASALVVNLGSRRLGVAGFGHEGGIFLMASDLGCIMRAWGIPEELMALSDAFAMVRDERAYCYDWVVKIPEVQYSIHERSIPIQCLQPIAFNHAMLMLREFIGAIINKDT